MLIELQPVVLSNGLIIRFVDQTNRYYGDFHRVFIKVQIFLPENFILPASLQHETACFERTLEKMGVVSDLVEKEKQGLIQAFLETAKPYLEKDSFPPQLLHKIQQQKKKPTFVFNSQN